MPPEDAPKNATKDVPGEARTGALLEPDPEILIQIARMKMPFGRYAGTRLIDLPEPYLVWFQNKGYPRGRLGELLETLYVIKANGLEALLAPMRDPSDPRYRETDPRDFREGDR
ncbi:MAG: hypothetical protein CL933_13745 [Deltaproteobacteria bacterium]|nr:hypothetical protein [Deltaproteobacteria bacterium]